MGRKKCLTFSFFPYYYIKKYYKRFYLISIIKKVRINKTLLYKTIFPSILLYTYPRIIQFPNCNFVRNNLVRISQYISITYINSMFIRYYAHTVVIYVLYELCVIIIAALQHVIEFYLRKYINIVYFILHSYYSSQLPYIPFYIIYNSLRIFFSQEF